MRSFLNITRQPYEEPYHVNLLLSVGNRFMQTQFEVYANASDLNDATESLVGFPRETIKVRWYYANLAGYYRFKYN